MKKVFFSGLVAVAAISGVFASKANTNTNLTTRTATPVYLSGDCNNLRSCDTNLTTGQVCSEITGTSFYSTAGCINEIPAPAGKLVPQN